MNKQFLHDFIDSDVGGSIIASIVLLTIAFVFFFIKPLKIRNNFLRYIMSILFTVATTLLLSDLLLTQSIGIVKAIIHREPTAAILYMIIAFFSFVLVRLSVKRYKALFSSSKYNYVNSEMSPRAKFLAWLYFIPVLLFIIIRVYILDLSFETPGVIIIVSSIIVIPVIEELMFRVLLPKLIRSEKTKYYDVVILSIVFQIVHFDAANLMPFIISIYLYFIILRTGKIYIIILIHAILNFSFYFYPYP